MRPRQASSHVPPCQHRHHGTTPPRQCFAIGAKGCKWRTGCQEKTRRDQAPSEAVTHQGQGDSPSSIGPGRRAQPRAEQLPSALCGTAQEAPCPVPMLSTTAFPALLQAYPICPCPQGFGILRHDAGCLAAQQQKLVGGVREG